MQTKQIAFLKPCVAELITTTVQPPKADEVQIKISVSTVSSGTERANLLGDKNVSIQSESVDRFPRVLGYSTAGTVIAVGENVSKFKVGDRVAMSWTTHTLVQNVNAQNVYKLPDNVSMNDGALLHISTFPLAAIRKCRLEIGESAIVMGMGILGLIAIPLLKTAGAVPVIAVDPIAEKREKALEIGADYALNPFADDFAQKVRELTNGGTNVGIEVTGVGAGLNGILDCMARFGRVALLGCTRDKDFTVDYYRKVHGPGITLIGAHTKARPDTESHGGWWTKEDDINAVIKLTSAGRIKLSDMVDEIHSPLEAPAVYTRLASEQSFPIVQFDWSEM